jgi:hypothetical protein
MSETLFKKVDYPLSQLIGDIEMGHIGLPDIQRPFVWRNAKVRNLFDSIYRGYPVGYFLFWQNDNDGKRGIGTDQKQKVPNLLIVDGQQRLTSIYAVVKGVPILRESYQKENIEIAFRPTDDSFEVADAAIRKDPEFIPNISVLWRKTANLFEIVGAYIANLSNHRQANNKTLSTEEITKIQSAIQRVSNLLSYPFTALELSSSIDEEQVAEIFVRINSEGKVLNQSDFILTLMSVFWEEGRAQLEDFCRAARTPSKGSPGPFNYFIDPAPDNLLRVAIGVGFRRARLKYGYALLRGKDLETDLFSVERRIEQFDVLKTSQADVLNLQNWHGFLRTLQLAGYRGADMISSDNALIYAYTLYLIGKRSFGIDGFTLSNIIAQWFFMVSLTGRYTGGAPETAMERDLASIRDFKNADQFATWVDKTIQDSFTEDFWKITLPNRLNTSSATSPILYAYFASLNLLQANVLFSRKKVIDLLDPASKGDKAAAERHHLFSKKYLKSKGIKSTKETNQVANYALVEWDDNLTMSGDAPSDYWPAYAAKFSDHQLALMCHWHALPINWHLLEYHEFLDARRRLMSKIIKEGFEKIGQGLSPEFDGHDDRPLKEILASGETTQIEFKATLRVNLHTGLPDKKMEHSCIKSIAAFLNSQGGHLVIGVGDGGDVLGIEKDGFPNEDKMNLHLVHLLRDRIGPHHMLHIDPRFEDLDGQRVLVVRCNPSNLPVYVKDGNSEQFFTRTGAATTELLPSQIQAYLQQRF